MLCTSRRPPPAPPQCVSTVQVGGEVACMLVFAGFLFVGLKTKAGAGQVKAWNMQSNLEYPPMEGHTVGARAPACPGQWRPCSMMWWLVLQRHGRGTCCHTAALSHSTLGGSGPLEPAERELGVAGG